MTLVPAAPVRSSRSATGRNYNYAMLHIDSKLAKEGIILGFGGYSGILSQELFQIGTEYARASLSVTKTRVSGNLAHHAIECILKAWIVHEVKLDTRSDVKKFFLVMKDGYSHHLLQLWSDFKKLNPKFCRSPHDKLIRGIDKWEEIRYPTLGHLRMIFGKGARFAADEMGINEYKEQGDYILDQDEFKSLYNNLVKELAPYVGFPPPEQYLLPD